MKYDICIKNGHVIDTANNVDEIKDIYVKNGRIVEFQGEFEAVRTIDASGLYVVPGLIDSHVHVFNKGCDLGIPADIVMLPYGVTTVGEGGSCGVSNYRSFIEMMRGSRVRHKMLINVSPEGLITFQHPEIICPEKWDFDSFYKAFDLDKNEIMGLKLRLSDEVVGSKGIEILKASLNLAEKLNTRLVVHVTATTIPQEEVLNLLRKDDIYCHVYQGFDETILDKDGKVKKAAYEAQKRGVIMDAASGKNNFSFEVAKKAIEEGFYPDVICSDVSSMNYLAEYVGTGLPYIMSKFLALGMDFKEIIKRVTENPAKVMKMENEAGSLSVGSIADIAIIDIKDTDVNFIDAHRNPLKGNKLIVPVATIQCGDLIYKSMCL